MFLEKEPTEAELELSLNQSGSNKAPGPYGMNAEVLKKLWPQLKESMMITLMEFFTCGKLPTGMNSAFIALIGMKLISKLLNNRLSKIAVSNFLRIRAGLIGEDDVDKDWIKLALSQRLRLYFLPREEMSGADELAKQGAQRNFEEMDADDGEVAGNGEDEDEGLQLFEGVGLEGMGIRTKFQVRLWHAGGLFSY
ncbi:hypothetical protein POM88_026032 [Heracleum sosnowskyi]|uniref:Uncharacterized protein n=1 Tax=Heracleum sosnowskyi TaxID=360622 RepID=A0AAD8I7G0_9APIA|nr:hypothetical protein POM88_026032 [Heracleum sosnowskyi]